MTKMKFCGLTRPEDVAAVNELKPDYIGFVFWPRSKRLVSDEQAAALKQLLSPEIQAVGVFVDETPETVASIANRDIIDLIQLHGSEDAEYIRQLRALTPKPIIRAFRMKAVESISEITDCTADFILLDSGMGSGTTFDWSTIPDLGRPYFLAGGLCPENAAEAVAQLHPYALDVSSGIETGGKKDPAKMAAFAAAVRKESQL